MSVIPLSPLDLSLAGVLVVLLALATHLYRLGMTNSLLIAAGRMVVQLLLVGLVLRALFAQVNLWFIGLLGLAMLLVASREIMARQKHRLRGWWSFSIGAVTMFISSFSITILALVVMVSPDPWYTPQYAIPLLGMLLGNTMTGISLSLDRLTTSAWQQRRLIEQRLMLGESRKGALSEISRDSLRSGMIPIINSMATAGIVSLPGMMTGQILAGTPPMEAVKYQILIWLLITAGTGFGMIAAIDLAGRRLFDSRDRLRLDRLQPAAK